MKKTLTIILIIIWMTTIFIFSHQPSEESSNLSESFTTKILKILNLYPENQEQLDKIETVIRKLAHYFIYLIGGILIYTHLNLYNTKTGNKIAISQTIGSFYAISDEFHQTFVMGRSGEIRDVIIDSAGVITGILIITLIIKIRRKENNERIKTI